MKRLNAIQIIRIGNMAALIVVAFLLLLCLPVVGWQISALLQQPQPTL